LRYSVGVKERTQTLSDYSCSADNNPKSEGDTQVNPGPDPAPAEGPTLTHSGNLLTLTVSTDGEVHAHPGLSFTPEHMGFLIEATGAVQDAMKHISAGQS
jgi:hypothetical protein